MIKFILDQLITLNNYHFPPFHSSDHMPFGHLIVLYLDTCTTLDLKFKTLPSKTLNQNEHQALIIVRLHPSFSFLVHLRQKYFCKQIQKHLKIWFELYATSLKKWRRMRGIYSYPFSEYIFGYGKLDPVVQSIHLCS